jgi:hypothetical protein
MRSFVHYVPILTTVLAAIFGAEVLRRFRARPQALHLAWWAGGIFVYGLGTLFESLVTLFGWHAVLFRAWYVSGALLGGAPLAQGSVYFHLKRSTAHRLTALLVAYVAVAACIVAVVPIDASAVEAHRLSGRVMAWPWVRLFSPVVNLYAVVFLIGGAILSALRARRDPAGRDRARGNWLIALGAILPGIGGSFTRLGHVEVLYVMEFIGILLIWRGYRLCTR